VRQADESTALQRVVSMLSDRVWNSVVQDIAEYDRHNETNALAETPHEPLRRIISSSVNQAREGLIEIADKNDAVAVIVRLLNKVQQSVRAEIGCLRIDVFESLREPFVFALHSGWMDEAAFELHATLPHTVQFLTAAEALLTHPVQGLRLRQIGGGAGAALGA
jgi:quinol monooxygenase YgiN